LIVGAGRSGKTTLANVLAASDETVYTEYTPYVLDRYKTTDINEPEDLEFAKLLYRAAQKRRRTSGNA
jgi:CMP-N-acetylneuraminic acid synthetase